MIRKNFTKQITILSFANIILEKNFKICKMNKNKQVENIAIVFT